MLLKDIFITELQKIIYYHSTINDISDENDYIFAMKLINDFLNKWVPKYAQEAYDFSETDDKD